MIATTRQKTVTVSATTLFHVAAEQLGDATQWNRIAALNGLWDPVITGLTTLKIPAVNAQAGNGGVLGI